MLLEKLDSKQYEQTIKFLNKTFKQRFEKVLPKIYGDDKYRESHLVALEDDWLNSILPLPIYVPSVDRV